MAKIAIGIEYCGRDFNGWQCQDHGRTIQESVEQALSTVANEPVKIQCAGRTDAGVHAVHQVGHIVTNITREMHSWVLGGNANLPRDVSLQWAQPVDDDFHARFSATGRHYRYVILNHRSRSALLDHKVTWECRGLDADKMAIAAEPLLGEHDFSSFRAIACQAKSPVRTIRRLQVKRRGDYIILDIEANAFLHHMVRNIVGVLMAIGMDKEDVSWSEEVLHARDRTLGGVTAPADGLYLVRVDYPDTFAIPMPDNQRWPLCL